MINSTVRETGASSDSIDPTGSGHSDRGKLSYTAPELKAVLVRMQQLQKQLASLRWKTPKSFMNFSQSPNMAVILAPIGSWESSPYFNNTLSRRAFLVAH